MLSTAAHSTSNYIQVLTAGAGAGFMPIGASAVTGILAVATALTMLETQSEHLICFVGV